MGEYRPKNGGNSASIPSFDKEFWHDATHQGVAPGQAVSGLTSVAPGVARGAEHGARE